MNKIMVVDDEPSQLKAIKRIFSETEYELSLLQEGRLVIEQARTYLPDLIMLDLCMPDADGYAICSDLKSAPELCDIMVLIVSGHSALDDRLKGYEALADDFIAKPYEPEELLAKVRILLRLKAAQDELKNMNLMLEQLVTKRTQELIQREKKAMLGDMLQGIIHNLQNPLAVIHSTTELATSALASCLDQVRSEDIQLSADKVGHHIGLIEEAASRIDAMIERLLVHGQAQNRASRQSLDLNDVVRRELEFLNHNQELKYHITKHFALDPNLPLLNVVFSDLSQVIGNIVTNAVDAMRESSCKELVIVSRQDSDNIYLDFKDTGDGIPPEYLERIFDPFFSTKERRGTADANGGSGTGLGLHVCSQLVGSYGGEIIARNNPNGGAIFTIRLPKETTVAG